MLSIIVNIDSFLFESFEYPLNLTSYKKEELETLCDRKYRRTPISKFL